MNGEFVLAALGLLAVGCTKTTDVRPDELPKLNGAFTTQVGSVSRVGTAQTSGGQTYTTYSSQPVYAVAVFHVLDPSGRTVEVKGEFDLVLTLRNGQSYEFDHPVLSTIHPDGTLEVRGHNREPIRGPVLDVQRAAIVQQDGTMTVLAGAGAGILIGVVVAAALISTL